MLYFLGGRLRTRPCWAFVRRKRTGLRMSFSRRIVSFAVLGERGLEIGWLMFLFHQMYSDQGLYWMKWI